MRRVEATIAQRERVTWFPLLPVIATSPSEDEPGSTARCMPWKLDTGCALSCAAWGDQLEALGARVALGRRRLGEGFATLSFEKLCPGLDNLQWAVPQGEEN